MSSPDTILSNEFNTAFSLWNELFNHTTQPNALQQQKQLQARALTPEDDFSPLYLASWWYYYRKMQKDSEPMGFVLASCLYRAIQSSAPHSQTLSLNKIMERSYQHGVHITVDDAFSVHFIAQRIMSRLKQYSLGCRSFSGM